ncbi:MAG: hypothetical protein M1835_005823 [Candelina submexicana]|nr:MAG: hypothetical protein M1835_005823 [Candelina submexicana]
MPSSPRTPRRYRGSSNGDSSYTSITPESRNAGYAPTSHSRNSSLQSTPTTPNRRQSQGSVGFSHIMGNDSAPGGELNGLGSLADELADAWAEDQEEDEDGSYVPIDGRVENSNGSAYEFLGQDLQHTRDSGIDVTSSPVKPPLEDNTSTPPKKPSTSKHQRVPPQPNRSDSWHEPGPDEPVTITLELEARMAAIERFARGVPDLDREGVGGAVASMLNGLRDLGSQTGVENGTTRLINAHTSLTTHVAHQTRSFYSLTYPLLSPLSAPPDADTIEELLPLITAAVSLIPQATSLNLSSLSQLMYYTTDLVQTLNYLSDTLHMTRQTTTLATRRLRSTRDLVAEMRKETEAMEEGIRWINKGGWQERLAERECASVCRDVVGGFEEVCNGWRERLVASAEIGAA